MANTFRKNPDWDEIIIKDVNCSGISRTKMDKTWLYATGKVYYTIVKKNNYYGIIARAEKDDEFTGVCACKYESIFPLYVYDEFSDCNYAYFAVMKNKKYGLFRLETSNEISDKIYGREVVSCKYDQITQLETCKPYFNIILLINNRIKTDEYNDEKAYMDKVLTANMKLNN